MQSQVIVALKNPKPKVLKKNLIRVTTIQSRCGGEAPRLATPLNPMGFGL
jgi:hypothetical protein